LNGDSLVSIASYADKVRPLRPETERWHYVNIPRASNKYKEKRDCAITRHGDCVVRAVEQFRQTLADPAASSKDRTEALRFLVHFVGDMHQPMHATGEKDRGGNLVNVRFRNGDTNLHSVWDSSLLDSAGLSEEMWLKKLADGVQPGMDGSNFVTWAVEAHKLAEKYAYPMPADHVLGEDYRERALPVVEGQLRKAGLRLAKVLNEALR
jgi:hypothetical protein